MAAWNVGFRTLEPLAAFPRLITIACETQTSPRYHWRGRLRQRERHCLFKITLSGCGMLRDAAGDHRLPPGTGFLCHICDPAIEYLYPPGATAPWTFLYVCFDGAAAVAMLGDFVSRYGNRHQLPLDRGLVGELAAWQRHAGSSVVIGPGEGASAVARLFAALFPARGGAGRDDLCRRAIEAIDANLDRPLTVARLAGMLGVSREHLARSFAAAGLPPPQRYRERRRMVEACRRLQRDDAPIAGIAASLGFAQPAHFCRAFRRAIGATPSRFRQGGIVPIE